MKRKISVIFAAIILLSVSLSAKGPKYVFYFIGDGMGLNTVYGTQLYNAALTGQQEPQSLLCTSFPCRGFITTYSANSLVTDSSAAGSALACGEKINNGAMARTPDGRDLVSIARRAKEAGFGAAVLSSVGVNHATPAAFYSNADSRGEYYNIAMQLIENERIDFAGGSGFLNDREGGCEVLIQKARENGWNVVTDEAVKTQDCEASPKTICLLNGKGSDIGYEIENPALHLEDLTKAALANMTKYHIKKGFFMMVEGGRIDYANHNNDAVASFQEMNGLDKAIAVAYEFYRKHPKETLILLTADHETGGVIIGDGTFESIREVLPCQKISKGELSTKLGELRKNGTPTWEQARKVIAEGTGLFEAIPVSVKEEAALMVCFADTFQGRDSGKEKNLYAQNEKLAAAVFDLFERKAMATYTFRSHSGAQVPVFAIGCGAEDIAACRDNTDIPKTIARIANY